jgi:hypothetical protein
MDLMAVFPGDVQTWVSILFPPFEVIGLGEPQDWPWDEHIRGGPPKTD